MAKVRTSVDCEVSWDLGINRRVQDHVMREIISLFKLLDGFLSEDGNVGKYRKYDKYKRHVNVRNTKIKST